jgi:penicillin-binding protein 1C
MKKFLLKLQYVVVFLVSLFFIFIIAIPGIHFNEPVSPVLCFSNNEIASARIANDGQWRFSGGNFPNKFAVCLMAFEDKNFLMHKGVDPASIIRAAKQNYQHSKIISGGSTISMQLARLSRKSKSRTYLDKLIEICMAIRFELFHNKIEILKSFIQHAPFGGNIVGLEGASWRYFGKDPNLLSWAEAACLAVLPNAPALIFPGKNQHKLLIKRNTLLKKLFINGLISFEDYRLSISEELPKKIFSLPHFCDPLLNTAFKKQNNTDRIVTSIDEILQKRSEEILRSYIPRFKSDQVHNAAILIAEIKSGKVLAYHGNVPFELKSQHGEEVDIIQNVRSTGSLLKPFLFASMLEDGYINPFQFIPDIPTQIGGFKPQNYSLEYEGLVSAKKALARSLNIPAVKMLQQYGVNKFKDRLQTFGINTIKKSADHYGMSLILGGAEAKLWELCSVYARMAQKVNGNDEIGLYFSEENKEKSKSIPINKNNLYLMFDAMAEVNRPDIDAYWRKLNNGKKISWKTGTSFGFRDAWAIGLNSDYLIGVWVGNASGEGRPSLTGISAAAPLLFELFSLLPATSKWFNKPIQNWKKISICSESGFLATRFCNQSKITEISSSSNYANFCPYHAQIALSKDLKFKVNSDCENIENIVMKSYLILPPIIEKYYKQKNPQFENPPELRADCNTNVLKKLAILYPQNNSLIYIPNDLNGKISNVIAEAVHSDKKAILYWSLDGAYLRSTQGKHQMALNPEKGHHVLSISTNEGEISEVQFEITNAKK